MKLVQIPNFRVEDYPSETSWIARLFVNINPLIQSLNQIINGNLAFGDNIKSVSNTYNVTGFQQFSFSWPYTDVPPNEVVILKSNKGVTQTPTILLHSWSFDQTKNLITVNNMVEVVGTTLEAMSGKYQFIMRATV